MNRINELFQQKNNRILNVYFTAGFPQLESTTEILRELDAANVDLMEIGMPYSDPLADGETIQQSSSKALTNGLTLPILFQQLSNARTITDKPLILMGYLNQLLQFGLNTFCQKAAACGIDGLIIPDMPLSVYEEEYQELIESYGLQCIFLVTPRTPDRRIRTIDKLSKGFIYLVADSSITGKSGKITQQQIDYFTRIQTMDLKNPVLVGFGISTKENFDMVCDHAPGAIIGSAFIRHLQAGKKPKEFVDSILE